MEQKDYSKLRWKIVATTLCFSLIPLFALGFSVYKQFSVSYSAKIMENLRTLAENRRSTINLFFDERISQLTTLAYTHPLNQLKEEGYLDKVFDIMQTRSKSFVDLGIIDEKGNHAAYSGPYNRLKEVNYKNEPWFAAVKLRGVYISDVFMGFRRFPHFIIAVMCREGDRCWILRATIDTDIFDGMVRAAQVGKKGDAFVVNRDNVLQTTPRFGGGLLGHPKSPDFSASVGTRVEEIELDGEKSLFATTVIAKNKWVLVIREDPKEALTPILKARYSGGLLFIAGVLIIVAGTVLIARAMIAHLIQVDREKAMLDAGLVQSSKMAALGKLAAGIAHEINNPLSVIKEKAGWMKDLLEDEDIAGSTSYKEFESSIDKIDQHVERARKVIHRLLGFARRMEPVHEMVDINRTMDEAVDFLENEARYRNIDIQTDYLENLPRTKSDSSQLQQVFLNIIDNAIDAIGKDGEINIKTDYDPRNRQIAIAIADSGPGIPRDMLKRVFDPFFSTKESGQGTGLGLSISYGIVERLGGRIAVESPEGRGTTFTVYLPIER
ncbi:MAG: two-component sensor histidine kinase [Desulfobacterales bacterium]|nr:two-component sensor histidine kinase [Desulfobacterales bacterium]